MSITRKKYNKSNNTSRDINTYNTRKNIKYRINRCKTKKIKTININNKKEFINNLIYYWIKYTNGNVKIDKTPIYAEDYYFSYYKDHDYDNHIHLILKGFNYNNNTHNNIKYVIKKMNIKSNKIEHTMPYKISIYSNPETVIKNMIKNHDKFILS